MSRIKELRTDTIQREVTIELRCDICGAKCQDASGEWETAPYRFDCVTVELTEGKGHMGGGDCEATSYDVCPTCWREKLVPFLESFGAKPKKRDVEW